MAVFASIQRVATLVACGQSLLKAFDVKSTVTSMANSPVAAFFASGFAAFFAKISRCLAQLPFTGHGSMLGRPQSTTPVALMCAEMNSAFHAATSFVEHGGP